MKRLFPVLVLFLLVQCAPKHKPDFYFPLSKGNEWTFSGNIKKIIVNKIDKDKNGKLVFTLIYHDSTNTPLWEEELVKNKNQLFWSVFDPQIGLLPKTSFSPPIPVTPFSDKIGEHLDFTSIESRNDSLNTELEISLAYEIDAIEDIKTPAGTFLQCIKMRTTFSYTSPTLKPMFAGISFWWFAKGIGPVRYYNANGHGDLLAATIDGVMIP